MSDPKIRNIDINTHTKVTVSPTTNGPPIVRTYITKYPPSTTTTTKTIKYGENGNKPADISIQRDLDISLSDPAPQTLVTSGMEQQEHEVNVGGGSEDNQLVTIQVPSTGAPWRLNPQPVEHKYVVHHYDHQSVPGHQIIHLSTTNPVKRTTTRRTTTTRTTRTWNLVHPNGDVIATTGPQLAPENPRPSPTSTTGQEDLIQHQIYREKLKIAQLESELREKGLPISEKK